MNNPKKSLDKKKRLSIQTPNYILAQELSQFYKQKYNAEILHIADEVTHDLKFSLSCLEEHVKKTNSLRESVSKIRKVYNNFLNILTSTSNALELFDSHLPTPIVPLITSTITKKRKQLKEKISFVIDTEENVKKVYVDLDPMEFMEAISKIVDNLIKAIGNKKGTICFSLALWTDVIRLVISDNGCALSEYKPYEDKMSKIKESISKYGGTVFVSSTKGKGTNVSICLPVSKPLEHLTNSYTIKKHIYVIDDEAITVDIIKAAINEEISIKEKPTIQYFPNPEEFFKSYKEKEVATIFIGNIFLGSSLSGIDAIKKLKNKDSIYLLTNKKESINLKDECLSLGIKMIPKLYLPILKISF